MPKKRRIIIVAGPNGAGKTTFAREYLPKEANCPDFVNVDLIAAGLSPFDPTRAAIRAARIMVSEIQRRVRKGESFAFETTLSGHVYARLIPRWRADGYRVKLIFLSLPNPEIAIKRVTARVAQGGHHVASTVVRRRFDSGLRNFQDIYRDLVDKWEWYGNSGNTPKLISEEGSWRQSMSRRVNPPSREAQDTLRALRRAAKRALELGIKTGTPVYVIRNNQIVDLTKVQPATRKSRSKRASSRVSSK
jgi:predicted ABC-type ATPase